MSTTNPKPGTERDFFAEACAIHEEHAPQPTTNSGWRDRTRLATTEHHILLRANVRLNPHQARELGRALWTAAWDVEHPTREQLAERAERHAKAQRELTDDLLEFGRQLGQELAEDIGWSPPDSDPDSPF